MYGMDTHTTVKTLLSKGLNRPQDRRIIGHSHQINQTSYTGHIVRYNSFDGLAGEKANWL